MNVYKKEILLLSLVLIFGCGEARESQDEVTKENGNIKTDTIQISLQAGSISSEIELLSNNYLHAQIEAGNLDDGLDTSFSIIQFKECKLPKNYTVFLIEGEFIPSHTLFHLCGINKKGGAVCFDYTYSVADLYTDMSFAILQENLIVLHGEQIEAYDKVVEPDGELLLCEM